MEEGGGGVLRLWDPELSGCREVCRVTSRLRTTWDVESGVICLSRVAARILRMGGGVGFWGFF